MSDFDDKRDVRSFLQARSPSIDRRFRPRPEKKTRLFEGIDEHDEMSSDESSSDNTESAIVVGDTSSNECGAMVYLRLRPVEYPSSTYTISGDGNVLITGTSNEKHISNPNKGNVEKHYSFSAILDSEVGQREVFTKCIGQKIVDEENFTIMTYGTSGSGKTYTLLGDEVQAGIIPRSLENIFTLYASNIYSEPSLKLVAGRLSILEDDCVLKELQVRRRILAACPNVDMQHRRLKQIVEEEHGFETRNHGEVSVFVWVSFVEIYNEFVYDLLTVPENTGNAQSQISEPSRRNLKIISNAGNVFIKELISVFVKSSLEALQLLRFGRQRLTYASTAVNANSSRSHCVFFVDVLKFYSNGQITQHSHKFCDLAGSERVDKTGTIGSRLKEAQRINTSLMVLGRCLNSASDITRKKTNDVIPFRESKLTMLLQSALLGKEKLTMVVNVTPLDKFYEENLNVLNFASIAMDIKFKPPPVKPRNPRFSWFLECSKLGQSTTQERIGFEQLVEENLSLRDELERVKAQHKLELAQLESELRNSLVDSFESMLRREREESKQRLTQELRNATRLHEAQLSLIRRQYEEQIEDLRDELDEFRIEVDYEDNDDNNVTNTDEQSIDRADEIL